MSYQRMDHAEWVQLQLTAAKRHKMTAADRKRASEGEGWFAAPDTLSPDQARIFDILGMVGGGIYNAPISWERVHWRYGRGLAVLWRGELSSFDFYKLTLLLFLCHEARIRVFVEAAARGYLRLGFHPRGDAGGMAARHPNLAEAVAAFRGYLPADHRIIFTPPPGPGPGYDPATDDPRRAAANWRAQLQQANDYIGDP